MPERQLRLFECPQPLVERLGAEFFRAVPRRPGVYIMCGGLGEALYVGQSANLRARLGSYRSANPEHLSRRIIRLIHSVASITWEECESAALARVRENELLRLHRPRFNRANVYPRAYCFIGIDFREGQLTSSRTTERDCAPRHFGAFKGGAIYGLASLLRLLWIALHEASSVFDLPRPLVRAKAPLRFSFTLPAQSRLETEELFSLLESYFAGESPEIISRLLAAAGDIETRPVFERNLIEADVESALSFFETGPRRNRRLKAEHASGERMIAQEDLDDWIALSSYRKQ